MTRFNTVTSKIGATLLAAAATIIAITLIVVPQTSAQSFNRAISWASTGRLVFSDTAPTIASGFGTSPSIVASNGAVAFRVGVGTGGTASAGVITMPAATTGWSCRVEDLTRTAANGADQRTVQTATTTTTVTVQNQTVTTGAALAWTSADNLLLLCGAY